ncbi:hypothetical protein OJAV_G00130990 [Oryzias javanicus]|uniref:Uncharacterized protein n=1 Tax=Oryzias javanicus TaxID=123683 RepID=A0A3S2PET1_ORYJA|nr:hypothetical protein OJAV_G00130990 [Oryzias javanicus]
MFQQEPVSSTGPGRLLRTSSVNPLSKLEYASLVLLRHMNIRSQATHKRVPIWSLVTKKCKRKKISNGVCPKSFPSLNDTTISRLIDAASLGDEQDTCGSISALLDQFEYSLDQNGLTPSRTSDFRPELRSPLKKKTSPHDRKFLISPHEIAQQKINMNAAMCSPSYGSQSDLQDLALTSSPETAELEEVYTILDEEVLLPPSVHNQTKQTDHIQAGTTVRSPSKSVQTLGKDHSMDWKDVNRSRGESVETEERVYEEPSDPLTEQLRRLVSLEGDNSDAERPVSPLRRQEAQSQFLPRNDSPPVLTRRLSSRSQSRVRHINSRARERQQEAMKSQPEVVNGGTASNGGVVLRNKPTSQNLSTNRHSTGSYIAGYLDELDDRGLPEGTCTFLRHSSGDHYGDLYRRDDPLPSLHSSHSVSEPEVYFLLRL